MTNKPKAKQAQSIDDAKQPHIKHLNRVKAALAAIGLEAPLLTIDLILKLNEEVQIRGDKFNFEDAHRIAQDNYAWHGRE